MVKKKLFFNFRIGIRSKLLYYKFEFYLLPIYEYSILTDIVYAQTYVDMLYACIWVYISYFYSIDIIKTLKCTIINLFYNIINVRNL